MRYLLFSLIFLFIWLIAFLFFKRLRREMITISLFLTPLAFLEPFFVPQYWNPDAILGPKLSIEDFIFCFSVSGLMAIIYEIILGKHLHHLKLRYSFRGEAVHILILLSGLLAVFLVYLLLEVNFMYAAYAGIVVDILVMSLLRRDLVKKLIFTALLFGTLYFILFFIFVHLLAPDFVRFWNVHSLSGLLVLGIPIEEIIWAVGAGALAGPMYEFLLSIRLKTN